MTDKHFAAQKLATWFKTYKTFDEQFNGDGLKELIDCAIHCVCIDRDEEVFTLDEIALFVQLIKECIVEEGIFQLVRQGLVATSIKDDDLVFHTILKSTEKS
jgi:hypothetical protein